jgi:hypothetical protein
MRTEGHRESGKCSVLSVLVSDRGDPVLYVVRTCRFRFKNVFPFRLSNGQVISGFFLNRDRSANCSVHFSYLNNFPTLGNVHYK